MILDDLRHSPRLPPAASRSSICAIFAARRWPIPQLHCYVPKEIAEELRRRAEAEDTSVSALLGALVKREVGAQDDWPQGYFERVVGGWQGEPLERLPQPPAEEREAL